jgi:hypothetical protein
MPSKRNNIYTHSIDLKKLHIKNRPRNEFAKLIEQIQYRGYEVEKLRDGRRIVITKPGGKRSFWGNMKKEDYFVFIFNPPDELWQITHNQIREDLEEKAKSNLVHTIKILKALEQVYNGKELDDKIFVQLDSKDHSGETAEALIKAYKWIWGQEDVNYPLPKFKGRAMSWEGWEKDKKNNEWRRTHKGIRDLLKKLQKNKCKRITKKQT